MATIIKFSEIKKRYIANKKSYNFETLAMYLLAKGYEIRKTNEIDWRTKDKVSKSQGFEIIKNNEVIHACHSLSLLQMTIVTENLR